MKPAHAVAALVAIAFTSPAVSVQNVRITPLGDVHVVLLTHAHGDHIGDRKLSGDTGIHSEMKTVVGDFHKANLVRAYPGVSERTMQFDGRGQSVAGCAN